MLKIIEKDPFRAFFPLGALFALVGVFPWSFHLFGTPSYPVEFHRAIMMNGFMLSFVTGFLMTAVPRFTSAGFAKSYEIFTAMLFIAVGGVFAALDLGAYHYLSVFIALITLITFAGKRFKARKANPPFTFVFIGVGLVLWAVSSFMIGLYLFNEQLRPTPLSVWGDLFSNGALMAVVLGVGGRLIPGILGWQEVVNTQRDRYEKAQSFVAAVPMLVWILVSIFVASYLLKPWVSTSILLFSRAFVICVFAFKYWKLHRPPQEKTFLTWSIWASCWCFVGGSIVNALWIDLYTHMLHAILVGGFSLLTVLIATRVTLAHGTEGKEAEKTSWFIPAFSFFLLLDMLTRVTAPLWPQIYLNHLSYAALTWIVGFVVWGLFCIPKMFNYKLFKFS